ncbi:hypothetical protein VTO42DRAFT_2712 [Malbranchea cinnamomea]
MAPTRRRSGHANPASHHSTQSTLNFGHKARVSKPTQRHVDAKKEKEKAEILRTELPSASPVHDTVHEIEEPARQQPAAASSKSENVVREQARAEMQAPKSEVDIKAAKLTDADIRRYWEAEEKKRRAPRVHQEDLSINEKILRHFDLCSHYGPCIGIARIKRWRRAHALDLNPPLEVLAVLLKEEAKGTANQKAYIDELMS